MDRLRFLAASRSHTKFGFDFRIFGGAEKPSRPSKKLKGIPDSMLERQKLIPFCSFSSVLMSLATVKLKLARCATKLLTTAQLTDSTKIRMDRKTHCGIVQ